MADPSAPLWDLCLRTTSHGFADSLWKATYFMPSPAGNECLKRRLLHSLGGVIPSKNYWRLPRMMPDEPSSPTMQAQWLPSLFVHQLVDAFTPHLFTRTVSEAGPVAGVGIPQEAGPAWSFRGGDADIQGGETLNERGLTTGTEAVNERKAHTHRSGEGGRGWSGRPNTRG